MKGKDARWLMSQKPYRLRPQKDPRKTKEAWLRGIFSGELTGQSQLQGQKGREQISQGFQLFGQSPQHLCRLPPGICHLATRNPHIRTCNMEAIWKIISQMVVIPSVGKCCIKNHPDDTEENGEKMWIVSTLSSKARHLKKISKYFKIYIISSE